MGIYNRFYRLYFTNLETQNYFYGKKCNPGTIYQAVFLVLYFLGVFVHTEIIYYPHR